MKKSEIFLESKINPLKDKFGMLRAYIDFEHVKTYGKIVGLEKDIEFLDSWEGKYKPWDSISRIESFKAEIDKLMGL